MVYVFREELVPQLYLEIFPQAYGVQSILDVLYLQTPPKFGVVYEIHRGYCHLHVVGTSWRGFEVLFDIKNEVLQLFGSWFPLKGLGSGNFSLLDPVLVCPAEIFSCMSSIVVLNSYANLLNKLIIVFCSTSNSSSRPSLCVTELLGLPDGLGLLVGATFSSSEITRNISFAIGNPSRRLPIASISTTFPLNSFTCVSKKRMVSGTSLRNNISSSIKVSRSACALGVDFVVDMFSVFAISRSLQSSDTTCHNRTFNGSGLAIMRCHNHTMKRVGCDPHAMTSKGAPLKRCPSDHMRANIEECHDAIEEDDASSNTTTQSGH